MTTTRFGQHVPDILDCLAQLSNDEVPTPPKLARAMLDLLPDDVWRRPDFVWLDPFSKSGVFLREIATRLFEGLADWEPDFAVRREHILRSMLHGASITEMTGIISRRSLYCSANASGPHSIVRFAEPQGNLPFIPAAHDFQANGRCSLCNAPEELERGEGRENYAYSFIHGTYPTQEMANMKFDVIVGNPPYQIDSDGNTRTMPIYQKFVDQAIALDPRYVLMITPSRWFAGGLGLDDFRTRMIADRRLAKLVDNPKIFDCFPGVKIRGGVSYFLWDREHHDDTEFSTRIDGTIRSTVRRDLRKGEGVLVRDNRAAVIIERVAQLGYPSVEETFGPQVPFGLRTNFAGSLESPFPNSIPLIYGTRVGYVRDDQLERNHAWVDRWKVLLPKASSGDTPLDGEGNIIDVVTGAPIALAPGSACTQTYFVAGVFHSAAETENYANYLATKFVRFLVLQRKVTQDITPDRFRFAPMLDMTRSWTDEELYDHFQLTPEERDYINLTIKPRSVNLSLDSPIPASHLSGGSKYRPGAGAEAPETDK
ncbi:Eco57I restriction-modification methylase domain-containing protein [Paeniglutamicibacter psychrophenolicus]|uniref:Site-specific DNA-methyltransferase (Adenine-specific) n=1 Tax=Paeniglutamicibacter psychrophenolicus TaxID=257454 RepID=A0ABS4WJR7_9MICC|nr:Eco57I restriction-modification methylase domain-containing protein [Paeniglutamicibacter psychrophenolicus]MBP2376445.1 site-specific DNA-methyltransferase (adenine-specific) [Paeniglutamicibacter psychrophenolicus]